MDKIKRKQYLNDGLICLIIFGILYGFSVFLSESTWLRLIISTIWHTFSLPITILIELINSTFDLEINDTLVSGWGVPIYLVYYLLLGTLVGKLFRLKNKRIKIFSFIMWGLILVMWGYTSIESTIFYQQCGDASYLVLLTLPVIIILFAVWLVVFYIFINK